MSLARRIGLAAALVALTWGALQAQGQSTPPPPIPKPFPQPVPPTGSSPPTTPTGVQPTTPTRPATSRVARTDAPADVQALAYPSADYLGAVDAGRGQHYYLFGTNTSYPDILMYYRNVLKNGGRELFKTPAMQQWDLGKFSEDTMIYPPSVVVKDYTWNGSEGYLHVDGVMEKRFRTVIQIVPPSSK